MEKKKKVRLDDFSPSGWKKACLDDDMLQRGFFGSHPPEVRTARGGGLDLVLASLWRRREGSFGFSQHLVLARLGRVCCSEKIEFTSIVTHERHLAFHLRRLRLDMVCRRFDWFLGHHDMVRVERARAGARAALWAAAVVVVVAVTVAAS